MKLTCETYSGVAVVGISGELNAEEIDAFRQLASRQLEAETRDFILDFSETQFVDSEGLEALLWLQEQAGERLGQVRLACCPDNLKTILTMTRLEHHFEQHDDIESAMKSLR